MPKHGKRYNTALAEFDRQTPVALGEAITRVQQSATTKFDETVELHIRTGLDPRHADQQVRGTTNLPHGLGKAVRVAVFAEGEAARDAEAAGAFIVGGDDLISKVADGFTGFDVALAQREMMGKVGKLGRILGPRGLMPNPRAGTVVGAADVGKAVVRRSARIWPTLRWRKSSPIVITARPSRSSRSATCWILRSVGIGGSFRRFVHGGGEGEKSPPRPAGLP